MTTPGTPKPPAQQPGSSFGDLIAYLCGPIFKASLQPTTPILLIVCAGVLKIVANWGLLSQTTDVGPYSEPSRLYIGFFTTLSEIASMFLWGSVVTALLIVAASIEDLRGEPAAPDSRT
ncbi:MAG: hypothetical protein ACF8Q5_01490 [Phycisphaerales bacterium JB040]